MAAYDIPTAVHRAVLAGTDRHPTPRAQEGEVSDRPIDRINLRHRIGGETVSLEAGRHRDGTVHLTIVPDDTLSAGYYEAFARLDSQSLGRLLHWLQTGEALPRDDERIPEPFGGAR